MTGESIAARMAPTGTKIVVESSDWYDHERNTIHLAKATARGSDYAAIGCAAHEAAHAVQHLLRTWQYRLWLSPVVQMEELTYLIAGFAVVGFIGYGYGALLLFGVVLLALTCLRMFAVFAIETEASEIAVAWLDLNTDMSAADAIQLRNMFKKARGTYWRMITS